MTASRSHVRYADDLEQPFPDEDELVRQVVEAMERATEQVAAKHRHGLRDAHAKSHGILAGELRIESALPAHLAQGLFATPRTYPVIVRFSTAPGDLRSDQVPVQRGMAIKVLGVDGPRAVDDGLTTQDLMLVNHPTIPFGTIGEYAKLQKLLERQPRQGDQQLQASGLGARVAPADSPVSAARCRRRSRPCPPPTTTSSARHSTRWRRSATASTWPRSPPRPARRTSGRSPAGPSTGERASRRSATSSSRSSPSRAPSTSCGRNCASTPTGCRSRTPRCSGLRSCRRTRPSRCCACLPNPRTATKGAATPTTSCRSTHGTRSQRTGRSGSIMRSRRAAYPRSSDSRHRVNGIDQHEPSSIDELPA